MMISGIIFLLKFFTTFPSSHWCLHSAYFYDDNDDNTEAAAASSAAMMTTVRFPSLPQRVSKCVAQKPKVRKIIYHIRNVLSPDQ